MVVMEEKKDNISSNTNDKTKAKSGRLTGFKSALLFWKKSKLPDRFFMLSLKFHRNSEWKNVIFSR